MINVGIHGICGRMGMRIAQLISEQKDMKLSLALERPGHPALGQDTGSIPGFNRATGINLTSVKELLSSGTPKHSRTDIILDFSAPSATLSCLEICTRHKIALLVGTTGLTQPILARIKQAGKKIPCLVSPNFSLGANMLMQSAEALTRLSASVSQAGRIGTQYDIEIIESHHRTKKDMPSGTALRLAERIQAHLPAKSPAIPIHALRIGDVVGEHRVIFGGRGEVIELTHRAQSRDAFIQGVLHCARILARLKPGYYGIEEILTKKFA
jgi:4-hydroxy-tetrahydrodipicolinate reductase